MRKSRRWRVASAQLEDFLDCAFAGTPLLTPAVRVATLPARHPATDCVRARLRLNAAAAASGPGGPVLLSVVGGGVLRQVLLEGSEDAVLEFPGPIERVFTLRVLRRAGRERGAVRERWISDRLPRDGPGHERARSRESRRGGRGAHEARGAATLDFLAALYCLQGALGDVPSWPAREPVLARRSLERFLVLWTPNPARPGADVAESPARWVREQLERMNGAR